MFILGANKSMLVGKKTFLDLIQSRLYMIANIYPEM